MYRKLIISLLLFSIVVLIFIFSVKVKEKIKYKSVDKYNKLAILINGIPSTIIPIDKYYYMSSSCNGINLLWNVLEKKLKIKGMDTPISTSSCTVSFDEVNLDVKFCETTNFNPTGDLFIREKNCGDAEMTYSNNKLNIEFNTKPETCTIKLAERNGNPPVLVTGMTPVKWTGDPGSYVESTTTADDPEWYDYSQKKWANAKTGDGSYWVWIPRFAYKITSGFHTSSVGTIEVKFLTGETNTSKDGGTIETTGYVAGTKDTSMYYFTHPAFTFGTDELTGIWVAKYEASVADTADLCYTTANDTNCNKTTLIPAFKSGVTSWRYNTIGNMFDVSYNLRTNSNYGWNGTTIDTHLMKNIEWGAVAYLAQSIYGANQEIWMNNSSTYTTGCAGNNVSESGYAGCLNAYNTANGEKSSTTHNITGIYDISGGVWEYTSAYINNSNASLTSYAPQILSALDKYKDIYSKAALELTANNYSTNKNKYGDAIWETSSSVSIPYTFSWNGDYSTMPATNNTLFNRSGFFGHSTYAGAYNFGSNTGNVNNNVGFRAVAVIP